MKDTGQRKLKLWQQNVRATRGVQGTLLKLADKNRVDVIAVQEACPNTGGGPNQPAIASHGYKLAFEFQESHRVAFYVRHEVNKWKPTYVSDHRCTITLDTDLGTVHFHNFYIPPDLVRTWSIKLITDVLELEGGHVFMGDFNLHHAWWAGKTLVESRVTKLAKNLYLAMEDAGYVLAREPGQLTYEKVIEGVPTGSVIDLTILSPCKSEISTLLCDSSPN